MIATMPDFAVRLAQSADDVRAAQRLRYAVFVEELGGSGPMVDTDQRLEVDAFDAHSDHLILTDNARPSDDRVVGVYRLMRQPQAKAAGQFYSASEYDLTPLLTSNRRLLELGRSCLHRDYRGGSAMVQLWRGVSDYVYQHDIDVLFGVASFHGTDVARLAAPLSILHHRYLAPVDLRVQARAQNGLDMNLMPLEQIDRAAAMRAIPALIKAYLRLGGVVGQGAWIDHAFNTIDVCLVMDTARINQKQAAFYAKAHL